MNQEQKSPLAAAIFGIFVRSAVLTFGRIVIMGWYVYFALHFYTKVEDGGYMYWVGFLLSVFGLWQLIELLAKAAKLTGKAPHPDVAD